MNKTKYNVRHVKRTMDDFNADRNRFRFDYKGVTYELPCYGALDIIFTEIEKVVPEEVILELQDIIWEKIDNNENRWRYPKEAYKIADDYVDEEFAS